MSDWFACRPCQICNEESTIVCLCSRVNLCEQCLDIHMKLNLNTKHKPVPIDKLADFSDGSESKRTKVFNAIVSKLNNEVLHIEEFKRISIQRINDFIQSIKSELEVLVQEISKGIEELCSNIDEDLRSAISLSRLSLNVNHPILDLFKKCRTVEDVKRIEIVHKNLDIHKIDIREVIDSHYFFNIFMSRDIKARTMPMKNPADSTMKTHSVTNSISGFSESTPISALDSSMTSDYAFSQYIEDLDDKDLRLSRIWTTNDFKTTTEKITIEMELQERPKFTKEPKPQPEPTLRSLKQYKFQPFTEEIIAIELNSGLKSSMLTNEKLFPKSAWCQTEDEKLIFTGGFDGTARNNTILFNLNTNKIEKSSPMLNARFNHCLVSCGKYIYCIGGTDSKLIKSCEKFSLSEKSWKKCGALIIGREQPGVCTHSNKIYICGGNGIESLETFNPTTKKFILLTLRLPSPGKCCMFPYDSNIFILQKENLFKIELPKLSFSKLATVEPNDWWSPCEPLITVDKVYFYCLESIYQLSLDPSPYEITQLFNLP